MKKIYNICCNQLVNPLGIDSDSPSFSWTIQSDQNHVYQTAYSVKVWISDTNETVWDSGKFISDQSIHIPYEGKALLPKTEYSYEVTVWDNYGDRLTGERQTFETGFLGKDAWEAKWIGRIPKESKDMEETPSSDEMGKLLLNMMSGADVQFKPDRKLEPCYIHRKCFELNQDVKIKRARVYVTALGIYEMKINACAISNDRWMPGFTPYDKYVEYQTYDVTKQLHTGHNVLTITLADGWYKGKFGILGFGDNYGSELAALMQLEVIYEDGHKEVIATDDSFQYTESPYVYGDLLIGEYYDARLEIKDLYQKELDTKSWEKSRIVEHDYDVLYGTIAEPVTVIQELEPKEIIITPKGDTVIDFGQNMVGHVRMKLWAPEGTEIRLEHTEVLDKVGNFVNCVDGFNRDQTDIYVAKGDFDEVYEPKFTFHGFRYVRINGYYGEIKKENFKGIVIGSTCEITGTFQSSNPLLNRLQSNILWSQKGNLLSIPTDCPQRERAGWTGDVWVYQETCGFNQDVLNFFQRWLKSMRLEQFEDGLVPIVIPYIKAYEALQLPAFGTHTSAGWGDVIVSLPWFLYKNYGDIKVLDENFESMLKWMKYVEKEAEEGVNLKEDKSEAAVKRQRYLWNTNFHFGDWLYPSCKDSEGKADMYRSANSTKEYIATCIYAYSTEVFSKVCEVLGKEELKIYYDELNTNIRKAFQEEYITKEGVIENDIQGLYVMSLAMNMVSEEVKPKLVARLDQLIKSNHNCLDTGFMSIKFLMDVLMDNGLKETAKAILYQDCCPSWLYEVKNDATTIWETWGSILEDGTRTKYSYNHYAFGCIGDWMYRTLLGINNSSIGYKEVTFKPDFNFNLDYVEGSYRSVYGNIVCKWRRQENKISLLLEVPANTKGILELEDVVEGSLTISDLAVKTDIGTEGKVKAELGNGRFVVEFISKSF